MMNGRDKPDHDRWLVSSAIPQAAQRPSGPFGRLIPTVTLACYTSAKLHICALSIAGLSSWPGWALWNGRLLQGATIPAPVSRSVTPRL